MQTKTNINRAFKLKFPSIEKFIFRGTTLGFPGSWACRKVPATCTSTDILVATSFAQVCANKFSVPAVIYVAKESGLSSVNQLPRNFLYKLEKSINWNIKPIDFYELCEGHIFLPNLLDILTKQDIKIEKPNSLSDLSPCLRLTPHLNVIKMEKLMIAITKELTKK